MSWVDQFIGDSQEARRLAIAAQILPTIVARGLHENPSQFLEHHWASLALKQADALLMAHAMTPIKVD
jgi:hypothetical protein